MRGSRNTPSSGGSDPRLIPKAHCFCTFSSRNFEVIFKRCHPEPGEGPYEGLTPRFCREGPAMVVTVNGPFHSIESGTFARSLAPASPPLTTTSSSHWDGEVECSAIQPARVIFRPSHRKTSPSAPQLLSSPATESDTRRRVAGPRRRPVARRSPRSVGHAEKSWCRSAGCRECS